MSTALVSPTPATTGGGEGAQQLVPPPTPTPGTTRHQHQHSTTASIPAGVMAEVHFREDYARLLAAVDQSYQDDSKIPQILFDNLESSDDGKVVLQALEDLSPIFEIVTPQEIFYEFLSLGGHTLVVLTLRKWMERDVKIVSHCCCCIARLIQKYEIGNKTFHVVRPLRLAGCIDYVLQALLNYKFSKDVQIYGIAALGNLCSGSTFFGQAQQAAQRLVQDCDIVTVVVDTMKRFPREEKVHEMVCCFLARICFLGMGEASAMKDHALVPVAQAVTMYQKNRIIEKNAASFMGAVLRS